MKKKTILFCTDSYNTGRGGVASYAHDFVDAFIGEYNIIVVTNDDYPKHEDYAVIQVKDKDYSLSNIRKFLSIVSEQSPDIIINSAYPLVSVITPFLPNSIKIISVSHFTDGRQACAAGMNAKYLDSIIALSSYGKRFIDKKFKVTDINKTKVIYNSMPAISDLDIEAKKKTSILNIVYPGGCAVAKSAEIVCHALKLLLKTDLNFNFYWLGRIKIPGANWPGNKIKQVKDVIGYNDCRIKHIGPVPREEAIKIIGKANVFLLPSRGEGCPITLLEAMRGGCISVISDAKHGSLDIIENDKTGFVIKQGSPYAIVECLQDIIRNHEKYIYMYDNSVSKFNDELDTQQWIKRMSSVLYAHCSHAKRKELNPIQLKLGIIKIRYYYKKDWLVDRLQQLYHVLYFRYIYHFV